MPSIATSWGCAVRPFLAGATLMAATSLPARADCVDDCQASTYCDSEMHASGECADKLNACYLSECSRPKTLYGAIAYDPVSGAYGYSFDFADAPGAEEKALASCRKQGGDCKVVLDFWNACGALAANGQGQYESAFGATEQEAQAKAVAACGAGCEIQAWSCTNN